MNKICPICNKQYHKSTKYCSRECQHISMKIYNYDINNPPRCLFCNSVLSHRLANVGYKFCSITCKRDYNFNQKQLKLDSAPKKMCEICKQPLTPQQVLDNRRVCSPKCAYELRVQLYGAVSEAHPDKFVQYATANDLRKNEQYCNKCGDFLRNLWKQEDFRKKQIDYMKTNNPVYKDGVVQKSNATKEQNGTLHTWMGVRGGNGKISDCEQLIYDFCIQHGFEYNKAINTYSIRKQYPDKHYGFNYKPDFTNFEYKLCVEVDGKAHYTTDGRLVDSKKEFCLNALGYTIIRFTNDEVKQNVKLVETIILNKLKELGWSCG